MKQGHPHETDDCRAISKILQRLGDKWTVLIVSKLGESEQPMRFNELRRTVGGISQKMLTSALRGLEADGFVTRTVFPTIPPRVDYELTELGREFLTPVSGLVVWAKENGARIIAARMGAATELREAAE